MSGSLLNKGKPQAQSIEGSNENLSAQQNMSAPLEPQEKTFEYAVIGGLDAINLQLCGGTISSVNKKITLNEEQNRELNKLIKSGNRFDLTQHLRLVDREEAERIAREYLASKGPAAHKGANSTLSRHALETALAENPGDRLKNMDVVEEEAIHAGDGPLESSKQ